MGDQFEKSFSVWLFCFLYVKMEGSLMIAGCLHMLVGLTGMVGFLLRFIGPVTVIPALTITSLYIYKATVTFAKTQWPVAIL